MTQYVSEISAHKGVREAMVAKQREIGKHGSIVAEGRDTTTVVFQDADFKFYMDASVRERAQRRLIDMVMPLTQDGNTPLFSAPKMPMLSIPAI